MKLHRETGFQDFEFDALTTEASQFLKLIWHSQDLLQGIIKAHSDASLRIK